jgi:predicted transcriptional regulator
MERTQIYLSPHQTAELDRRARARGTTRSALIREAVERYLGPTWDPDAFRAALNDFAGIWADRDDVYDEYLAMKERGRERMDELERRRDGETS